MKDSAMKKSLVLISLSILVLALNVACAAPAQPSVNSPRRKTVQPFRVL